MLDPPVGAPGLVTEASGAGFTPGSVLVLRWQPGLGVVRPVVGSNGTFRIRILILPNDRPGARLLVVDGDPSVTAPFLVVNGTAMPGGDMGVRFRH